MNLPSLSVVVPNYNHAKFLPTALEAIFSQSVAPLEVIVIDDASTDNSVEVIEEFARKHPTLRLVRHPTNKGVIEGMNEGLAMVRGECLLFAAADDQILPGLFEKSLQLLAQHPQAAISCTIAEWRELATGWNWHVGVQMGGQPCYLSPQRLVELERLTKLFISSNTVVMRPKLLGHYRAELRWHCDWFALMVAAFRHGACFVPEPLAVLNICPTSYHGAGRRKQEHLEVMRSIVRILHEPEYRDVLLLMRESAALYHFGWPMFTTLLGNPEWRHMLTPLMVRKCLWHAFKLQVKKITPSFAARWYFRLAGYRARSQKPA
ncbi:MAG: glycosyltransferase family 2 protein [Verrucomicrobia bacterium]|nr:glycosyltransferase family 2 protein [Verrucomicrobiota bacterium]